MYYGALEDSPPSLVILLKAITRSTVCQHIYREGKGLSFHRRPPFDCPLVSRKTAKKKFGSLFYNAAGSTAYSTVCCVCSSYSLLLTTRICGPYQALSVLSKKVLANMHACMPAIFKGCSFRCYHCKL